jgi:hypothetical protein
MMGRGRTTAVEDHRFPKARAREVAVKYEGAFDKTRERMPGIRKR